MNGNKRSSYEKIKFSDIIYIDIFRTIFLSYLDDNIQDLINLCSIRNMDLRRIMLFTLREWEIFQVTSHSGQYLLWLLQMNMSVKSVVIIGLVASEVLQMLYLLRKCKSISFRGSISKEISSNYWYQQIQSLKDSAAATAPRQLEEINYRTGYANVELSLLVDCPKLHTVRIHDANDDILVALCEYCTDLRTLGLAGCFSDEGLIPLLESCPHLETIQLTGKNDISEESIVTLSQVCPDVKTLVNNGDDPMNFDDEVINTLINLRFT